MKRPQAIALDIIETVFTLEPLGSRFKGAGLPETALRLFFAQLLRDAFALEASGVFKPFKEVAAASLAVLMANHGVAAEQAKIQSVLAAFAELPAHPDVATGLERVISIDEVRRWKPNHEVYLHAARTLGVEPSRLALIAAHAWDVHGAKQAGLIGAWVKRQDKVYHGALQPPDVQGSSMTTVAEA